ncbi:MAG: class I tRNA ligase family protein, partial [Oscillospiraceae bacterium]
YIELTKPRLNGEDEESRINAQKVLLYVLTETMKLLHPFMPFISEEIWQALPHEGEMLMLERFPEYSDKLAFPKDEQDFEILMEAIKAIRSRRAEMNVPPSRKAHLIIVTEKAGIFNGGKAFLMKLAYAGEISVMDKAPADIEGMVSVVTGDAKMFMPMADLVDLGKERERISRELEKAQKEYDGQMAKLSNESFLAKAPEKVIEAEKDRTAKAKALIENLTESLKKLG